MAACGHPSRRAQERAPQDEESLAAVGAVLLGPRRVMAVMLPLLHLGVAVAPVPADDPYRLLFRLRGRLRRYDGDRLYRYPVRNVVEFVGLRQRALNCLGFGRLVRDGNLLTR